MSRFQTVFKELDRLQDNLKNAANRLWKIRLSMASAYSEGLQDHDFLPRRLLEMRLETQKELDHHLNQLSRVLSSELDSTFIAFDALDDVQEVMRIRTMLRYIQNAFADELPLVSKLTRLNKTLPTYSNN